jgi:hypothetical protein
VYVRLRTKGFVEHTQGTALRMFHKIPLPKREACQICPDMTCFRLQGRKPKPAGADFSTKSTEGNKVYC